MRTILLSVSASLLVLSVTVTANELQAGSWNFPTADQIQVSQNRVQLFCSANPSKCPVGLSHSGAGGASGSGSSLMDPKTSSSANNISVVLAGDNSSVTLSTSQEADDNTMGANSSIDAEIDYDEVLNYSNH